MKTIDKKQYHRIYHILNRNIHVSYKYEFDEIREAFLVEDYDNTTSRQRMIYSKFFKECDVDDLETFEKVFGVSKRKIKKIYTQIPERVFLGVAEVWDKRFRLKYLDELKNRGCREYKIPLILQKIMDKKYKKKLKGKRRKGPITIKLITLKDYDVYDKNNHFDSLQHQGMDGYETLSDEFCEAVIDRYGDRGKEEIMRMVDRGQISLKDAVLILKDEYKKFAKLVPCVWDDDDECL
ncbi:hypothetical protein JHD48_10325 [Sulfurimonas sp. SAG-AH-194-I05]|nr:hypothetical protein [Sulfurimonas sp. SAG-AH-194-I05]MDF1876127.1 hypothetical protein [Sulfurimonas sp. SAG-AH-194-I05]